MTIEDKLISSIYEAAAGEQDWSDFVTQFGALYPHLKFSMVGYDQQFKNANIQASANFDPGMLDAYEEHFYAINPWGTLLENAPLPPDCYWGHDWVPMDNMKTTEFYNDWIVPQGNIATGFASKLFSEKDRFLVLAVNCNFDHLEEAERAQATLKRIGPHLRRGFEIQRRLNGLAAKVHDFETLLDQCTAPTLVLNRNQVVQFENAGCRALRQKSSLFWFGRDGLLKFSTPENKDAFDTLLANAGSSRTCDCRHVCILSGPGGQHLAVHVAPIIAREADTARALDERKDLRFMVFFSDPNTAPHTPVDMLTKTLKITHSEAQIAIALLNDVTVKDYAEQRQISEHTARTQLKSLLKKLGVSSQVQLVNYLARISR